MTPNASTIFFAILSLKQPVGATTLAVDVVAAAATTAFPTPAVVETPQLNTPLNVTLVVVLTLVLVTTLNLVFVVATVTVST